MNFIVKWVGYRCDRGNLIPIGRLVLLLSKIPTADWGTDGKDRGWSRVPRPIPYPLPSLNVRLSVIFIKKKKKKSPALNFRYSSSLSQIPLVDIKKKKSKLVRIAPICSCQLQEGHIY